MYARLAVLAVLAPMLAGCGVGEGTLHGTVSYKGRKLTQGTVTLTNGAGFFQTVDIQPDGTYRFDKVPTGKLKIGVESPNPGEVKKRIEIQAKAAAEGMPLRGTALGTVKVGDSKTWFEIPAGFAVPDDSGLTVDISSGENEHEIKLD